MQRLLMKNAQRPYTDEFKRKAVSLTTTGRPLLQIAAELGVRPSTLRSWQNAFNNDELKTRLEDFSAITSSSSNEEQPSHDQDHSKPPTRSDQSEEGFASSSSEGTDLASSKVDGEDRDVPQANLADSQLEDKDRFPEVAYIDNYPDVARAVSIGTFTSGYMHYLKYGRDEIARGDRRKIPELDLMSIVKTGNREVLGTSDFPAFRFDEVGDEFFEELYLELNPDVASAVKAGTIKSGYEHWFQTGCSEIAHDLRPPPTFGPPVSSGVDQRAISDLEIKSFDANGYFYLNPDVLAVAQGSAGAARDHWMSYGRFEGRVAPGMPRPSQRSINLHELCARPFGVNVFGPFAAQSGLGTAARGIAKAIKTAGIPFDLWAFDTSTGEIRPTSHHANDLPKYRVNLIMANADQIARVFAAYKKGHFDNAYNITVWQWELASFRPDWFYAFDGIDEVWTNSQFQFDAIKSIAPVPLVKIHLPVVPPKVACPSDRPMFGLPPDAYIFFAPFDIGSTSARKNPFAAIEAFRQINMRHKNTHFVLKCHGARHEPSFMSKLMIAIGGLSSITMISVELETRMMDKLKASCDCLISPHRSEGFGLNIAEFLSLGKAVIATDYSGNLDFFDASVGFPIGYKLVEVEHQAGPYRSGYIWAEPSIGSITEEMERVLTRPDDVRQRGKEAIQRIANLLSLERVGSDIEHRLSTIGLNKDIPLFAKQAGRSDIATRSIAFIKPLNESAILEHFPKGPLLSIVMPVYNVPARYLSACIASVIQQTYPLWELCISNDGSAAPDTLATLEKFRGISPMIKIVDAHRNRGIAEATNRAIEVAVGAFLVFLDNDDLLEETALEKVAKLLCDDPELDIIYSDEDKIDENGNRIDHFFKPDWSPEHLESVMYVLHLLVIRKSLVLKIGGLRPEYNGAQDYDLMLRCSRETNRIHHIAEVLYHWRAIPGSAAAVVDAKPEALENGRHALADHAKAKYGNTAMVEPGLLPGTFRLRRPLLYKPPVSLLIMTGNGSAFLPERGEINLVENFVRSILAKTSYLNYQIIVIDNGTLSSLQHTFFLDQGVQIEDFAPHSPFNYAAKANFAVRCAPTEHIVLLNDDMEIIREDWLDALIELSTDPGVGAVGARLLHFDGTIQHVGMVLGVNEGAAHIYHSFDRNFVGYNAFTHVIRNYSAVTAACLSTRKSVVAQVGWFDEDYAVDYNDVDFCLRVGEMGYRVVYTPYAELYHFEGASAKRTEQSPAEVERFQRRWAHMIDKDPYYNSHLTRNSLDFAERRDI